MEAYPSSMGKRLKLILKTADEFQHVVQIEALRVSVTLGGTVRCARISGRITWAFKEHVELE